MESEDLFYGPDRIEFSKAFGRPIRKGDFDQIKVSDFDRVKGALNKKDSETAMAYLGLMHALYTATNSTFFEWGIALPSTLANKGYDNIEPDITKKSREIWFEGAIEQYKHNEAVESMNIVLQNLNRESINEFRERQKNNESNQATVLFQNAFDHYKNLTESITKKDFDNAKIHFANYFGEMRLLHDLAGEFVSTYISRIEEKTSQKIAADVMQHSLESCPFVAGMWGLVEKLNPEELSAVMAEHLRCHFSGINRKGGVEIIEDEEKYRLIFEPCGTGQAIRLRDIKGLTKFPEASPETWNLKNEVPPYCSHCARNEITSISKLGYPAWVTEFNPDPKKPCGWTIYKDPKAIPEKYFKRLGLEKDSSKFKEK